MDIVIQERLDIAIFIHSQFKYGSNDKNITWANWQENEPNNYGGQDENCVGTNLVQYKWRYKWFDVNCNSHLAVVCQKNQDTPISEGMF